MASDRPRLAVRLTEDAERHVRSGHPWIFDRSIVSITEGGEAGDLAVIFDSRRKFVAIGLYDPASPIRIKVIRRGNPTPVDRDFWRSRMTAAAARRSELAASTATTGYRCVHGENDGLPGLIVDRFGETLVMKLYSAAWIPHLDDILEALADVFVPTPGSAVVLRLARNLVDLLAGDGWHDGQILRGELADPVVIFNENGLRFEADVISGQKTGFFLDQRDNRARVRDRSSGRRVLDVFSASGGFSVSAAAGGATLVHSVDVSAGAVEAARRNMAMNADRATVAACRHDVTVGDAASVMSDLLEDGRRYDMVIVDPPSFASRQSQRDGAFHAYRRLLSDALMLVDDRGMLVASSCSSRISAQEFTDVLYDAADDVDRSLYRPEMFEHGVDHPVGFSEGAYLKAVFAKVRPASSRTLEG